MIQRAQGSSSSLCHVTKLTGTYSKFYLHETDHEILSSFEKNVNES